jgi:hypothetical protein
LHPDLPAKKGVIAMRIGASLFLVAVGAILAFAVRDNLSSDFDVTMIGVILMVVGALGLLITLIMMNTRQRTDVIARRDGGTTVIEPTNPMIDPRY